MILMAAYTFAENEGYLGGYVSMPVEDYEIDDMVWTVTDEDAYLY